MKPLVQPRRGATALGCLFTMLVVVAICYFGANIGEAYWRFYQFQDDMRQEVKFASKNTNTIILTHLRADADSLGLPDDAQDIDVHRTRADISIEADYSETVELPMKKREFHFHPHASGSL